MIKMHKNFSKSFNYLEDFWQVGCRKCDLVMLYVVGKLFSKVEHIELSDLCVYFKGLIAKNCTATEDKFI